MDDYTKFKDLHQCVRDGRMYGKIETGNFSLSVWAIA